MIITINEDWRLASDPLQWAIQKRWASEKDERWNGVAYFRYFDHALVELARRRIGILEGSYRAEALMPLHRALQVISNDIRAALATFQTEAAAYHGRAGQ